MDIREHHERLRKINIEKKKIRLKFDLLYEKEKNILSTKKEKIVNQIKSRPNTVVSAPTNLNQLSKVDFLYKEYKEINKKIKKLRSEIDALFIKEAAPLADERDGIIKQIKLLSGNKPKKKKRKKKKSIKKFSNRRGKVKIKTSFEIFRARGYWSKPINKQAARMVGYRSKRKKY